MMKARAGEWENNGQSGKEPMNTRWSSSMMDLFSATRDHFQLEVHNSEYKQEASIMGKHSRKRGSQPFPNLSEDAKAQQLEEKEAKYLLQVPTPRKERVLFKISLMLCSAKLTWMAEKGYLFGSQKMMETAIRSIKSLILDFQLRLPCNMSEESYIFFMNKLIPSRRLSKAESSTPLSKISEFSFHLGSFTENFHLPNNDFFLIFLQ